MVGIIAAATQTMPITKTEAISIVATITTLLATDMAVKITDTMATTSSATTTGETSTVKTVEFEQFGFQEYWWPFWRW